MSKACSHFVKICLWAVVLVVSASVLHARAESLETLINNNRLSVEIRLISTPPIIARQPVQFEVEVATQRWFAKGTYIVNSSVENAVMLPASGLGVNSTKNISGVTWASQIREITLYPMQAGQYQLPPVEIHVSVNTEDYGVVQGRIFTQPVGFDVIIPQPLKQYDEYIVSPNVQLDLSEVSKNKDDYAVGEAIHQTITFSAVNVPGMMLPPLVKPEIPGLSIYHEPAQLNDQTSRGELTGVRTESVTYIFEQTGEYTLPEQVFYWWNMDTQELSTVTIPAKTWKVSGSALSNISASGNGYDFLPSIRQLVITIAMVMVALLVYVSYCKRGMLLELYSKLTKMRYRQLRRAYMQAIEEKQYRRACDILYQIVNQSNASQSRGNITSLESFYCGQPVQLKVLAQLFKSAYGAEEWVYLGDSDAKVLLQKPSKHKKSVKADTAAVTFQLNPK